MKEINTAQLREYFKTQGVTQREIAKTLNVHPAYISQLLRGKSVFGKKTAINFQEKFGISASWLLTGEGEMLYSDKGTEQDMVRDEDKITNRFVKLIDYIKYAKGLKQADIAEQLGVKPSYISDIRNGRVAFSPKLKKRIQELYSDCLRPEATNIHISGNANGSIVTGGDNNGSIIHGGNTAKETALARIPIIPRSITRVPDLDVMEYLKGRELGIESSNVIVENMPISVWYCVEDYSLEPDYRKGDYVALLSYPVGKEVIIPGRLYVVDTYSNGMIMRYLFEDGNGNYIARAKNRESYPDFAIHKEDIIRVYKKMLLVRF